MPESTEPRYDNPPKIEAESVLVLGDLQIPFHDAAFLNKCISLARCWGIRRLLLGGDVLDLNAFSIWVTRSADANAELDEAERTMARVISGFATIDWLMGNHEDRIRKALGAWLSADRIRKLIGLGANVEAHDYYHCFVGDDWIVTHPKNTSVIPARVAVWLSEKFGRNVAMLHNHVCGVSQTRDGEHIGIDVGMCADPMRLEYNAIRMGTRPAMSQGALILRWCAEERRYYPHHLTQWADWEMLERIGEQWGKETESRKNRSGRASRTLSRMRRRNSAAKARKR